MGGSASGTGGGGSGGESACQKGQVAANEVLIIGDSLLTAANREIVVELRRLAGANYVDRSAPGARMANIVTQYDNAPAPQPKVVIMDGGGNDVLQNPSCSAGCTQHMQAITTFRTFLQQMSTEGVQHVVFISYYDMPSIAAGNDWMRPRLQAECQQSPVPCHFVDLRTLFVGQASNQYTTDGIHPTVAAADQCSAAIWSTMQQNCVAQ
jgi:lysophospholipase L1-like esterase